ncbi:MAG: TetR/AcrR family transcriptional regulator [Stellaceae bacterium]
MSRAEPARKGGSLPLREGARVAVPARPRAAPADAPQGDKYTRRYWEIIDAAAAEFAEQGYHGASTKAIADRLSIRQGSLYYYFSSKEAALEEVCYRGVEDFVVNLEVIVASDRGTAEKLRAVVFNHLTPLLARPDYVRVFLNQRHHLPRKSRRKIGAVSRRYERLVESIFEDGIAAGALRRDVEPRLATLAIIGLANSAAAWLGQRVPLTQLPVVANSLADLFLSGVEARPPGRKEPAT